MLPRCLTQPYLQHGSQPCPAPCLSRAASRCSFTFWRSSDGGSFPLRSLRRSPRCRSSSASLSRLIRPALYHNGKRVVRNFLRRSRRRPPPVPTPQEMSGGKCSPWRSLCHGSRLHRYPPSQCRLQRFRMQPLPRPVLRSPMRQGAPLRQAANRRAELPTALLPELTRMRCVRTASNWRLRQDASATIRRWRVPEAGRAWWRWPSWRDRSARRQCSWCGPRDMPCWTNRRSTC